MRDTKLAGKYENYMPIFSQVALGFVYMEIVWTFPRIQNVSPQNNISVCTYILVNNQYSYAWPIEISGRLSVLSSFRYFQPPASWIQCALESRELLALCLKKIKAPLSKVGGMVKIFIFRKSFCVEFALFW